MPNVRSLERFVLSYIRKHGDVGDCDQADQFLSELDQEEAKRAQVAGPNDVEDEADDPQANAGEAPAVGGPVAEAPPVVEGEEEEEAGDPE